MGSSKAPQILRPEIHINGFDPLPTIFTIGHSKHEIEYFLELLETQRISCVVDVRSIPASGRNPQYNKSALRSSLQEQDIIYLYFGKEFV